ncbi:MAG TPA: response regulator transcription factor, partial [Bacteroidia bacterium]|nr:response regulator transcription factor [Bacteroidia bacterium]
MTTEKVTSILLAEDDPNLGHLLQEYLNAKGFETVLATNGKEGFDQFRKGTFDLCLLDVMMPVKDGYTLAKEIRTMNTDIPIVFLTAKSMKEDTIEGFNVGADDYITKPFSMEELLLRLKAILRRTKGNDIDMNQTQFTIGDYKYDHTRQILDFGNKSQKLTSKEADLL